MIMELSEQKALEEYEIIRAKLFYIYGSGESNLIKLLERLIEERNAGLYGKRVEPDAIRYSGKIDISKISHKPSPVTVVDIDRKTGTVTFDTPAGQMPQKLQGNPSVPYSWKVSEGGSFPDGRLNYGENISPEIAAKLETLVKRDVKAMGERLDKITYGKPNQAFSNESFNGGNFPTVSDEPEGMCRNHSFIHKERKGCKDFIVVVQGKTAEFTGIYPSKPEDPEKFPTLDKGTVLSKEELAGPIIYVGNITKKQTGIPSVMTMGYPETAYTGNLQWMAERGVEGDLFHPHLRRDSCATSGCEPITAEQAKTIGEDLQELIWKKGAPKEAEASKDEVQEKDDE